MSDLFVGDDGVARCGWVAGAPEFVAYHDEEWGRPVHDDDRLFEKLSLEAFQSGLSWRTILVKRESFRAAFAGFHIPAVAAFGPDDVERLLGDAGIVRHRGKIEAVIGNARCAADLLDREGPGALSRLVWRHQPDPASLAPPQSVTTTAESVALSKELKKAGWRFVGPTTAYAFMQSMGLVDDHAIGCAFGGRRRRHVHSGRRSLARWRSGWTTSASSSRTWRRWPSSSSSSDSTSRGRARSKGSGPVV